MPLKVKIAKELLYLYGPVKAIQVCRLHVAEIIQKRSPLQPSLAALKVE